MYFLSSVCVVFVYVDAGNNNNSDLYLVIQQLQNEHAYSKLSRKLHWYEIMWPQAPSA